MLCRLTADKKKNGRPYILHPIRLILKMQSDLEMMASILHNVVEDAEWTLEDLRQEGFSEALLQAVDCLTHRKQVRYRDYIQRISENPVARKVTEGQLHPR